MWASGQRRFEPIAPSQMVLYVAAARADIKNGLEKRILEVMRS